MWMLGVDQRGVRSSQATCHHLLPMGLFQSKTAAGPDNKARCNISNAKEIKIYCDDTIEQVCIFK